MTCWTNGYEIFESEDEARDSVCENMTWEDLESYFRENVDFHDFFTSVRKAMPDFYETFENEFCDAENDYFQQNYWMVDEEEEE